MKKVVIVEDEEQYIPHFRRVLEKLGFVVEAIIPKSDDFAEKIAGKIIMANPSLILLDHDFRIDFVNSCFDGFSIFSMLDDLQKKTVSISGIDRPYIPKERSFSFKDNTDYNDGEETWESLFVAFLGEVLN